eukprot:8628591-Alexandrium_andersonii.AAC.1
MTIGKKIAWWPIVREDVALRARTGPSRRRLIVGLAGRGTLGVHGSAAASKAQAGLGVACRPAEPSIRE